MAQAGRGISAPNPSDCQPGFYCSGSYNECLQVCRPGSNECAPYGMSCYPFVDFGSLGVYVFYNDTNWTLLTGANPEGLLTADLGGDSRHRQQQKYGGQAARNYWSSKSNRLFLSCSLR